jgi:CheY-like chemotaxis protein
LQILIVEDNDVNATVLTHFLLPYKHQIDRVVNGLKGVEFVNNKKVDVIMMDLNMPIMSGYAACEKIRQNTHIEQPVIIAVSADTTPTSVEKCQTLGMDGFLAKPYSVKQLSEIVDQYLLP